MPLFTVLYELPKGYPITAEHFPATFLIPTAAPRSFLIALKSISQQLLAKTEQFLFIFPGNEHVYNF
jgi:hypothetical protein